MADAYSASLIALLEAGTRVAPVTDVLSVGSEFGHASRGSLELTGHAFRVSDPRECLLLCPPRQPSLPFVVGQWLWAMSGTDSLDQIVYYNSSGKLFSDDGQVLRAAVGRRMRGGVDQLDAAIQRLRADPTTRRAIIMLADPSDVGTNSRDQPCAMALHFLIRRGRLECFTSMRSQSALMVLPYDAALFMMLHTWVAAMLHLPVGPHTWSATSFHVYEDEIPLTTKVIESRVSPVSLPDLVDPEGEVEDLLVVEQRLRSLARRNDELDLVEPTDTPTSGPFADAISRVLLAHAAIRIGNPELWRDSVRGLPADWSRQLDPAPLTTPVESSLHDGGIGNRA